MSDSSDRFSIPYAILAGLILIRFLPFAAGTAWLWGVGQLTLLPTGYAIAMALIGAVILVLPFLPKAESRGEALAAWFSRTFYDSTSKYLARGVVLLIAAVAFILFRMPTHFLGDGMTYLANAASDSGHWIRWSEGGAMVAVMWVRSMLGKQNQETALTAFQILSAVSGLVTTWFYFLIAKQISLYPTKRMLTFVVLFVSSSLLLYFGYAESYPVLWGAMAGFLYFSLKYSTDGRGAIPALSCLLIAIMLHLQAGMFVPAMGFLLLSRGAGLRLYKRFRPLILAAVGIVIIACGVECYRKYTGNLAVENIFLYPFSGKPAAPGYAVFSAKHLSDIFNLFLLVYPVGLVVFVMTWTRVRRMSLDRTTVFLGLLTVGGLLFLFLIDPGLSMPRDWDLFSSCWLAPLILLLHLMPDLPTGAVKRLLPSLVLSSVLMVLPWLLVNLDEERGVAEIRQIIANNPKKSFGTMALMGTYFQQKGDQASAEENLRRVRLDYPDFFKIKDAFQMMANGRRDDAYRLFLQAKPDKFSKDYHSFLAGYYLQCGRGDDALEEAKAAVQLQVYFDRSYTLLAYAYMMKGEVDEGIKALRQGYSLNEKNKEFLTGLAQVHFNLKHFDSTLFYAEKLHQLDSTDPAYYYLSAKGYCGQKNVAKAQEQTSLYFKSGHSASGFMDNYDELERLLQAVK